MQVKTIVKTMALVSAATLVITIAMPADPSWGGGRSTSNRKDGGKSVTTTTRVGTECNVFSKSGALVCTRTFNITNHAAGVARCVALKC